MKLSIKLLFAFTLVGIVPLAITNTIYFYQAKKTLSEQSFNQLKTIRDLKKVQVERFFAQRQTDMDVLVQTIAKFKRDSLAKLTALQELKKAQIEEFFIGLHNDMSVLARSETLKKMFLKLKKHYEAMAVSPDGPFEVTSEQYQQIYSSKLSSFFINSIKTLKYSNLYIIHAPYGHVMYTVTQSSDLGTNLDTGPYREEGLARLWRKVVKTKTIVIEDFSPYTPLGGQPTAFIGAPLFDETQQQMTSIIALPIPKEAIDTIVQRRDGLGKTGETYLVGKTDNIIHYRSDRLLKSSQIGDPIQGVYIKKALQGETGITIQTNSTGVLEVIFYHPLHIQGLDWMISTAINYEELLAPKGKHRSKDFYTHYLEKYDDYDLFLIHPQGTVFYSVKHKADYHTNILKGQYAQTGLGKAIKHVLQTKQYTLIDVEHYPPSDQPAAFIAQPLLEDNQITLIVAIQLSADTLNRALHWRIARDKSSETYLVGSDKLMRSDSDLDPEHHSIFAAFANPDRGQVDTIASREALSGQTGEKKLTNYQGDKVLSVYTPVEIANSIRWALIAEIHQSEAFAAIDSIHFIILILFGIAILIIIIVATLLMRSIIKPITAVIDFSNQVKNGNTETVLEMNRRDEIGQMGAALNHMVLAQRQTIKQIQHAGIQVSSSATELAATAKQQKATMLNQLAFTHHVEHSMDDISKIAAELVQTMEQVADMSSETAELTTHSQAELAQMEAAMHSMEKASRSISYKLEAINEKTENITSVVTTITKVADQTNLLSLNAAIEAEKAGEYGRGFNVVAREIRRLADQTAIATLDIEQMVKEMQSAVAAGVMEMDKFITEVKHSAEDVGKISLQLNQIIEQVQALSPQFEEVKVAMTKQSQNAQEINHAMVDVGDGMQQTADSLEESFHAIEQLNEAAQGLQEEVLRFQNRASSYSTKIM